MIKAIGELPLLVKAGAVSGLLPGMTLGATTGSAMGVIYGVALGTGAGLLAGILLDRSEKRIARHVPIRKKASETRSERDLRIWMTEWLTPRAPQVR